jgi:hypothetical protein
VNRQTALISEECNVIKGMEPENIHRDDRFMVKAMDP